VSKKGYEWQSTAEDGWLSGGGGGNGYGGGWVATYCRRMGGYWLRSGMGGYTAKEENGIGPSGPLSAAAPESRQPSKIIIANWAA
jgi:hypothetical protein